MTVYRTYARLILRILATGIAVLALIAVGYVLREVPIAFNPILWASLQVITAFLSFSIAANVLVRFLGTRDRASLILGSGFALNGLIQLGSIVSFYYQWSDQASLSTLAWMIGETLVALLLLVAFPVDESLPWPRQPKRVVLAVMTVVLTAGYLIAITFLALPLQLTIRPSGILPRPGDLVPAGIFLGATWVLYRSKRRNRSAFDAMLVGVAAINSGCHFIAAQSAIPLDVPAMTAQLCKAGSYVLLLGATLVDNVSLFGQVQDRARRDSLTGLANYRSLLDIMQAEFERSGRTNRAFSVLLMDLDGFKEVNDQHGHLAGNRVLCRVAEVLRLHCRSIDTAARYGGDEFALVLPETDETAAHQVAFRIEQYLAANMEMPQVGLSVGTATFPQDGLNIQQLLEAADRKLYIAKASANRASSWRQLPLGL